jgi:uncharacterized protein YdhG (YjbR/CyaY superfamily)
VKAAGRAHDILDSMAAASTVEEYIGGFPPEVRVLLLRLRETLRQAVPNGVETMAFGMPTIMVEGERAISWSAAKKNVTILTPGSLPQSLAREAEDYRVDDGVQFPYRKEVPFEFIADLAKHLAANRG